MREFLLDFDVRDGKRVGLERGLRAAIREGRLPAGTLLPSTRSLANDYEMARATVVAAYEQLTIEGYLVAHQGAGTRVANVAQVAELRSDNGNLWPKAPTADFRPGEPDGAQFPRSSWGQAVRRVLAESTDGAFGYADPRGVAELRSVLAEYLGRSRAVVATPNSVSVFGGVTASFGFLAEMFLRQGIERVAVEDPSLFLLRDVLTMVGLTIVPVRVDGDGIDVEHLSSLEVGAVVVTPAHQFPLGVTMSAPRRSELLQWARNNDAWIVEDDYDGEFRYDRRPIGSLQGLDPDRVIYAGTASKMLSPALRLSWLVVPEALHASLADVKHLRGGVSTIEQLALASFIDRGDLDRHLRANRSHYQQRRSEVAAVLDRCSRWLAPSTAQAGLHLAATFIDPAIDEQGLIEEASAVGLGLLGFGPLWLGSPRSQGLVIGFSRPAAHEFARSLDTLDDFLRSIR